MILSILTGVLIAYAFCAFCNWEYYPKYWTQEARMATSLAMVCAGCTGALIYLA